MAMTLSPDIYHIQSNLFRKHRFLNLCIALILYVASILIFGNRLHVSSNFFVALPVISAAMGFGFWGGFSAGMLGLPINLILFHIIGHPEFSPESKLMAEFFGILVGGSMGALGDYFRILNQEIEHGRIMAEELSQKVGDREILIQEVHHRVKNNLTLILSLLQLQRNQNSSGEFRRAMDIVNARIRAIASVHHYIYTHETSTSVNLQRHIPALCRAIIESQNVPDLSFHHDVQFRNGISLQKATPLSLIVLEILTNSCKHAFSPDQQDPRIFLYGRETDREFILIISDNGGQAGSEVLWDHGHGAEPSTSMAATGQAGSNSTNGTGAADLISDVKAGQKADTGSGLGSTIIRALAKQIRADLIVNTEKGYEYVIKIKKPRL